jgi:dolichyl-phosphate-mannose--protein O-mannosyl transferase
MSYNKTPLIKTLIPLGLSGIFFGMGAASKWICLYAGAGLAVIFFLSLFKRWKEYMYAKNDGTGLSKNDIEKIKKEYLLKTLVTLGWCVIFFIVIPIGIYIASYIPIMKIGPAKDLSYVWRNQINMFNYHSGLDSSHPFASPWYEWPIIIKPMWYYSNDIVRGTGKMGSIAAFGNPAVWWLGVIAMIYLFVDTYLQKKISKAAIFLILAFFSQYLPWVLVPRSMFIYHYFASVPFVVIAIVYAIKSLEERWNIKRKVVWYYLAVVIVLFAMFYPVLTGTVIPSWYGKVLKWMPTWWFTY